jgi:peptidoglycan LD-endopeptidase CwlK
MIRAPITPAAMARNLPQQPQATPVVFNEKSMALLSQVDPRLADLMIRVEAQHPNAFEITEGMRDATRQAQLVAEGKSQTQNSRHLTGKAVDIHMLGPGGKANWDFEAYRPVADTAKRVAAEMGIPDFVWGGDWKSLRDGVHFQIGGPGGSGGSGAQMAGGAAPQAGPQLGPAPETGSPEAPGLAGLFGAVPVVAPQRRSAQADHEDQTRKRRQAFFGSGGLADVYG